MKPPVEALQAPAPVASDPSQVALIRRQMGIKE
jgi:hypothetical protein